MYGSADTVRGVVGNEEEVSVGHVGYRCPGDTLAPALYSEPGREGKVALVLLVVFTAVLGEVADLVLC